MKSEPQRSYKHGSYKKKSVNDSQFGVKKDKTNKTALWMNEYTLFYKNHVYKNVEAQKCPFLKNIVVIY